MKTAIRRVGSSSLSRAQPLARRAYAFQAAGAPVFEVFNRKTKWLQKERAAANVEASRQADYLKDEVAVRLCERLLVHLPHSLPARPKAWLRGAKRYTEFVH